MYKYIFFLFLVFSIVCAEGVWQLQTGGAIESKPVFFENKMVVASHDGFVYYVYVQNGALANKTKIDEKINELGIGNGLIVGASKNKIILLNKNGALLHTINQTIVYGIELGNNIYATTDKGLVAMDYEGNSVWKIPEEGKTLTPPLLVNDTIIFGSGDELVVVEKGIQKQRIKIAQFWNSKPAFYNNTVFIGSTDGNMYAINLLKNKIAWRISTSGWIMSNPIYNKGYIYFGSNDGNIYAVNANNGALVWKTQTTEAVQGNLEIFTLGKNEFVLAGGNDNQVHALNAKDGNVAFTISVDGWVHNPTFNSGTLFFGSADGLFYAYNPNRICTIFPLQEEVGYIPFNITGRVFSQYPGVTVSIRISDLTKNGSWVSPAIYGSNWTYLIDPNDYVFGRILIECKASDNSGTQTKDLAYLVFIRNINAKKAKMTVDAPSIVTENKPFTLKVYDENRVAIDKFTVITTTKTFSGINGTITLTVAEGVNTLIIRKIGYEDEKVQITANYDITFIFLIVFMLIGIAVSAFYFFIYKKK